MKTMNPVVHFEMPTDDPKRVAKFYTDVFGWENKLMGPEMNDYVLATTTESDEKGPKKLGAINGGFFAKSKSESKSPSVVIQVDDIKNHMEKVKTAGGKVIGLPVEIPGVGHYVSFVDTEGNVVSMLQPHIT